jgi:hypothetical protein
MKIKFILFVRLKKKSLILLKEKLLNLIINNIKKKQLLF